MSIQTDEVARLGKENDKLKAKLARIKEYMAVHEPPDSDLRLAIEDIIDNAYETGGTST